MLLKARDPEMHQTKKGTQWHFGMKIHSGVDASTGYVHTITATAANTHDIVETHHLVREDDSTVYADSGYLGIEKRDEIKNDEHCAKNRYRGLKKTSHVPYFVHISKSSDVSTVRQAKRFLPCYGIGAPACGEFLQIGSIGNKYRFISSMKMNR